ncbi:MAG TPA: hypothetical protein VG501_12390 [Rhizomicrobium sp.]|nr:hypothetical protein [Rhizomicrobium sp.]
MSIPITGLLLIPLGLTIIMLPWRFCLIGLMIFAMMSPAAVVNVGRVGLQPGYYLGLLMIGRTAAEIMVQKFSLNTFAISQMRSLWWFIALVFLVLFIALCFFQGTVDVLPGTYGYKTGNTHPFYFARENLTQIAYLLINFTLLYCLAHGAARQKLAKLISAWDAAIVCGLFFAVAVCVWQFFSFYAGIPFPTDFFYSNAGYSRSDSQALVGLLRINGPFEEPSILGYTFTGYMLFSWARYRTHPTTLTIVMLVASLLCSLLSSSTTALAGIFLFLGLVLYDVATGKVNLVPTRFRLSPARFLAIAAVFAIILVGAFAAADNWGAIQFILRDVLFDKAGTTSFKQRSFADFLALQIFTETYGIGVGLGSHKANSLLLTLLSNTGLIGVVLFGWFLFGILTWKRSLDESRADAIRPFQLFLLGLLTMHVISNPNLSVLTFWLLMGSMLGLKTAEHRQEAGAGVMPDLGLSPQNRLVGTARKSLA